MLIDELLESWKIVLKISGAFPEEWERSPMYSWLKIYCAFVITAIFCVLQIAGIVMFVTIDNAPEYFVELNAFMIAMTKVLPLVVHRNKIMQLLWESKKFESLLKKSDKELKVAEFWQTCRDRIVKFLITGYCIMMMAFFIAALFSKDKLFPLKLVFKPNTIFSPWYEVIYAVEVIKCIPMLSCVMASDTFAVILMCQLCQELQLITLSLDNPSKDNRESLVRIIRKHATVLKFGEEVCNLLSIAFFAQHCFICFILCFCGFTVLTVQNSVTVDKRTLLWTIFLATSMLFMCCSAGEIVITMSEGFANALMHSNLLGFRNTEGNVIHLDDIRRISFMILRAQKPLRLSVGTFGMINLQFFSTTMKTTFSFMMILRTLYD